MILCSLRPNYCEIVTSGMVPGFVKMALRAEMRYKPNNTCKMMAKTRPFPSVPSAVFMVSEEKASAKEFGNFVNSFMEISKNDPAWVVAVVAASYL